MRLFKVRIKAEAHGKASLCVSLGEEFLQTRQGQQRASTGVFVAHCIIGHKPLGTRLSMKSSGKGQVAHFCLSVHRQRKEE